ncbi:MAG: fibronectin type III domain-containing protein, partial [Thermoguttaceae bacterium]|nr:fibronectin type III domain-containing protein [Thermoguttaceae bacterium]
VANLDVATISEASVVDAETLPAQPSDFQFGVFADGRLETSWRDEAVNEDGYKVYYCVDGGEWRLAATLKSTEAVSATSGNIVERVATKVRPESVYSFRVSAFVVDAAGNEIESTPLEATWRADSGTTQIAAPSLFAFGEYDAASRTLPLFWSAVDGALGYEVEYRDSSDGGATWRRDWTLAQKTTATERTATAVYANYRYEFRVRALGVGGRVSERTLIVFDAANVTFVKQEDNAVCEMAPSLVDALFADNNDDFEDWLSVIR